MAWDTLCRCVVFVCLRRPRAPGADAGKSIPSSSCLAVTVPLKSFVPLALAGDREGARARP